MPVNCATVSPALIEAELFGQAGRDGLFVYAQGGTLFLDEVAELPLPLQATLLRVLEHRRMRPVGSEQEIPVDVRIVAASNRPLRDEVDAGRFRADLYYRLQVVEINLPPLAAHKDDIPDLVAHFNATLAPQLGVPPIAVSDEPGGAFADRWCAQRVGAVPEPAAQPAAACGRDAGAGRPHRPAHAGEAPHPGGAGVG